jgi:hypothetical protein
MRVLARRRGDVRQIDLRQIDVRHIKAGMDSSSAAHDSYNPTWLKADS